MTPNPSLANGIPQSVLAPRCRRSAGGRVLALLCVLLSPGLSSAQDWGAQSPNKVKAAFLRNFAHYVIWPSHAFQDGGLPWRIGILGPDPFGDVLELTLKGRTEQGRPFAVFRADTLDKLPGCQIIFVALDDAAARRAVLGQLKDKPVLTVGDAREFLSEGGVIRFQVADRVGMSINLDQARAASLTIQTQMLELFHEVVDNGVMHRMR